VTVGALRIIVATWRVSAVARLAIDQVAVAKGGAGPGVSGVVTVGALRIIVTTWSVSVVARLAIGELGNVGEDSTRPGVDGAVAGRAPGIIVALRSISSVARNTILRKTRVVDVGPVVGVMAPGALAAGGHVNRGRCMTGLAVGIERVVKVDIVPRPSVVTVGALTGPVAVWRCMARRTVICSLMAKTDIGPVVNAVAIGALPDVVFLNRRGMA
jgi:hypothetical protein